MRRRGEASGAGKGHETTDNQGIVSKWSVKKKKKNLFEIKKKYCESQAKGLPCPKTHSLICSQRTARQEGPQTLPEGRDAESCASLHQHGVGPPVHPQKFQG